MPTTGIYGVQFTTATGPTNINADITGPLASSSTVAAWDVTVRATAASVANLNGRLFTYAWAGFTGVNNRPIYSQHHYVTLDGYRYTQSLAGLDPNGFALYANRLGFLDQGQPLYKGVRGSNSIVTDLATGLSAQRPEFPIFFSSVAPAAPHAAEVNKVLAALRIPLTPQAPSLANVTFTGPASSPAAHTRTGAGGTFRLSIANASTYQIIVSRDGVDFSPSNTANAVITGIAGSGTQDVVWAGTDTAGTPFPASGTPYAYRAFARAGEIHLPMIDTENNGNGSSPQTATFGGGPTILKLNGSQAGDTTVYFDDRGYITRSGTLIGQVNGSLCPAAPPTAPNPAQGAAGVDSTLVYGALARLYRWWPPGINANSDCAATGGWGDAKGLDLWTYVSASAVNGTLQVDPLPRDVSASVLAPASAQPGASVQGRIAYANHGAGAVNGLQYSLALDRSCAALPITFANLPTGASAACMDTLGQGRYVFSGFPAALAGGALVRGANAAAPMTFSYTAPVSGSVSVHATIAAALPDDVPGNDTATATTVISPVDLQTSASAPATALAGEMVTALVSFANVSGAQASPWVPTISIGAAGACPTGVQLMGGPPGVTMTSFNAATCAVALAGMPAVLADGQILSLTFRYQAPAGGQVIVTSSVATSGDVNAGNNSATATTTVAVVNMVISLAGLPASTGAGQAYLGTFSCTNAGLLDAVGGTRCAVDSGLPAGMSVTGCVLDRTGALWTTGSPVPAGAAVVCTVAGTAPVGIAQVVLAASTSATGEAIPANNSATITLMFAAPHAVPALGHAAVWILAGLLCLGYARRRQDSRSP